MIENKKVTVRFDKILILMDEIHAGHGREGTTYSAGINDGLRLLEKKLTDHVLKEQKND